MSRTTLYKAAYFAEMAAVAAVVAWVIVRFRPSLVGLALLVLALLAPGRILGFFWVDLLRGRRLLKARDFAESKRHSERFLATLRKRPWLRKLIWLGAGVYSRDPEAHALNNLGAAEIGLGDLEAARTHLLASITVDRHNPLPALNMGILCRRAGRPAEAASWFQQARELGYSGSAIDRFIRSREEHFAEADGAGQAPHDP